MATNNPTLVVTNPLHYTYLRRKYNVRSIGSKSGIIADYGEKLGFDSNLTLYDGPNSVEGLITADQQRTSNNHSYIAWKPVGVSAKLLGNSYALAHPLECKSLIRQALPVELFPKFVIIPADDLSQQSYNQLASQLQTDKIVLQIDFSSGGKGTFFVESDETFQAAKPALLAADQAVVVSKYLAGTPRGLQCFMASGNVYNLAWWHKDLVGLQGVCAMQQPTATRYAGAVLENVPTLYQPQVKKIIDQVGVYLKGLGYYGIFGIDLVVDEVAQKVYLIELNPRVTAVSHLYATAMRATGSQNDFLTAYGKGLLNPEAQNDIGISLHAATSLPTPYFYLKLQNIAPTVVRLNDNCQLGVYDAKWQYQRFGFGVDALHGNAEIVVLPESSRRVPRSTGDRIFSLIGAGDPIQGGQLTAKWAKQVDVVRQHFLANEPSAR